MYGAIAAVLIETRDDAALLRLLMEDTPWATYAICDLEPAYRGNACYLSDGAGAPRGIVLEYTVDTFTTFIPCGDYSDTRSLLAAMTPREPAAFQAREPDLEVLSERFQVSQLTDMQRMIVDAAAMRLDTHSPLPIRRLMLADLPALFELYAAWPESVFSASMLATGTFYGAFDGERLIAVAGTHAVSPASRLGIIGCVFTRPEYRGRGLARATTAAVMADLREAGMETVALNVMAENEAAIGAYSALGFHIHQPFFEGVVASL